MLSSGPRLDNVAQELQKVQTCLASNSRDVLDENDEFLHVRYQLIYAIDTQEPLDKSAGILLKMYSISCAVMQESFMVGFLKRLNLLTAGMYTEEIESRQVPTN